MSDMTDTTVEIRSRGPAPSGVLVWTALGIAAAAALVAVVSMLSMSGRIERLRSENGAATERAAAAEKAGRDLKSTLDGVSARLAETEARCRKLEDALPPAGAGPREPSAQAAPDEPGNPGAGEIRAEAEKKAGEIAGIKEKLDKGELKPEEARDAVEAKVKEGLKAVLPPDTVERMEQALAEQAKNLTPEQKKQADQARARFLDGVASWASLQQQVKEGKITQEEANQQIRERMRQRMEEMRNAMPEDQRKAWEDRMKTRRQRRGGGAPRPADPPPAPNGEI